MIRVVKERMAMDEVHYLISDASRKVDVEAHVLRYWEEELEMNIPRNEMGHRYYTDFHIRLFKQVKNLKEKGYQLKAIKHALEQMKKDGTDYVWEDLRTIPEAELKSHFPNIVEHCRQQGYDVTKECIPVVPAQHYFMGGIKVDYESRTSMDRLYAVGETACNGVHGRNRLASNSLLESLVFAKRAAHNMIDSELADKLNASADAYITNMKLTDYEDENALNELYAKLVKDKIDEADAGKQTA